MLRFLLLLLVGWLAWSPSYAQSERTINGIVKDEFGTGLPGAHIVLLEGGDQAIVYGVNLSFNNIEGAMKGSTRNTFSGGITLSYRVKDLIFRNQLTIDYNSSDESPYGSFSDYAQMNPYSRLYDENGSLI